MPTSQFFGLMIGYSGLTAYQAAENTLANNVANTETEGYSRQYVARTAADALRTFTSYGMQGAGVKVTGIKQYRNVYYDNKYWTNNANVGRFETHEEYMTRIEKYFEDSDASNGFNTVYNSVFAGLEELKKDPGQTSTRTAFLGTAQTLTEYFRTLSGNLKKEQESLNNEIKTTVERINTIAKEIASLNKQINTIEIPGGAANELRDKRAILVDELSKIVDVTVTETPVVNEADKNNPTGANRYIVKISNGNTLVDGYETNELEVVGREDKDRHNQTDIDGLYDIRWKSTLSPFSVLADNLSGSLKSLFELRDGNNNENLKGKISSVTSGSVTFKADGFKANATMEDVISQLNVPQRGSINVSGTPLNYDSWSVEKRADGFYFTFNLAAGNEVGTDKVDKTARIGNSVDYQGIPYYMSQMNQWIRQFAYRFNNIEKDGEDLYGDDMDVSFFQYRDKDGGLQNFYEYDEKPDNFIFSTATEGDDPAFTGPYNYYFLTAENFYVNQDIIKDPKLMSTAGQESISDADVDVSASDIVDELEKIRSNKSVMEFRGCSSAEFLTCILSDISLNSMSAKTFKINSTNIQSAIQNQRDSVSSVDDDEEALDLVKFQNAYNLNAKVIQTMTEIYDRLILQTGV